MVSSSGPNSLTISNQDRWAAPLDQMIQSVIAEDLRDRLPAGQVIMPGDPSGPGTEGIDVNVSRFIPDTNGRVALHADWVLLDSSGKTLLTRSESLSATGASTQPTVVQTMNQALGDLAARIARALPGC